MIIRILNGKCYILKIKDEITFLEDNAFNPQFRKYSKAIPQSKGRQYLWDDLTSTIVTDDVAELAYVRAVKVKEINSAYSSYFNSITSDYPKEEIDTWTKQEALARAYKANNTTTVNMLYNLAKKRAIPLDLLANKIVEKADILDLLLGTAIGHRQALETAIENATTLEELQEIVWEL